MPWGQPPAPGVGLGYAPGAMARQRADETELLIAIDEELRNATDRTIQTLWFAKQVSRQAAAVKELYKQVKTAADERPSEAPTG